MSHHPQIDGQIERVNKVIAGTLIMYAMENPIRWKEYLPLLEFVYKNGHQGSLSMNPFNEMYGKRCRTPVSWDSPINRIILGTDFIKEMEYEVVPVKQNLKISQDKHKSYADQNWVDKEFKVGDHIYLWVKPKKSSLKLGSHYKLSPCYCGPFKIIERIGSGAYTLTLLVNVKIHDVFHVSLLKKYVYESTHIIDWKMI